MLNYLQLVVSPPEDSLLYTGSYNFMLVGISVIIAMFASYAALLVSQLVPLSNKSTAKSLWVLSGGLSLGVGIWAMHFIGMLAFNLPCSSSYDGTITFLSTIPGILASTLALKIISRRKITRSQLALGGVLIGAGIGAMHYSGMAAMRLNGLIRYDLGLFLLSIVVAIVLATFALWVKFRLQERMTNWAIPVSAVVMGGAVSAMHYMAMAAAYFIRGDRGGVIDLGISPTFLAAIVLASTSLIIVVTIVATYLSKPNFHFERRPYRLIAVLIVGWGLISWVSADYYYGRHTEALYQHSLQEVSKTLDELSGNIDEGFSILKSTSLVISRDVVAIKALHRFGASEASSQLPLEDRKSRWTQDKMLVDLNSYLSFVATNLGADNIFVINATGDCIASSNAGKKDSFVGSNFGDRAYFLQARSGGQGHQYAVGRVSNVPGFYYSHAVLESGHFVGAVVIKRSISRYSNLISQANAFIADTNGVIVLAQDKSMEFRYLPNAAVLSLSDDKRLLQYKKSVIEPLLIAPWKNQTFPDAVRLGDAKVPTLLLSKALPESSIAIYVSHSLHEIEQHDIEKFWFMLLLSIVGSMLIVTVSAIVLYLRESQQTKTDLSIAATAFEAQEGILITDANNEIVRVNRAFTIITGFELEDVVGRNPSILSSGHQNADFYASMWAGVAGTGAWRGEIWNRRKNGEIFSEFLTITAVKDASGAVTNYVGTFNDITASKEAEDKIRNLAFFDPLTGLPNRRLLMDRLHQALASCSRNKQEGALLHIDLDNFKALNDRLGHSTGDQLLQQVAQRLKACVREGDTVARFGGDEFVVILEDLGAQVLEAANHTETVAEKILANLNQPYLLGAHEYRSTTSIGATLFNGQQHATEDLMRQADIAMYQAKNAGRNTLRFFDPQMQESINSRAALEDALRNAIERKEFQLYYQIQVDVSHRPLGAEVLIRWIHPELGFVSPAQFIPLAEETGLMIPIGQWVLETACAQLKAWEQDELTRDLVLAVNVSAKQFRQVNFASQVQSTIQRLDIDPTRLKIELTESMLIENVEDTINTMNTLKAIGIQFSLDDFGTGYSSLQYLKRLPIDQLKIDQSFVRDISVDSNDKAIVRTIIAMADSLNLDIIAEGVETDEQRRLLQDRGCNNFQGYLFSKPVPIEQFALILNQYSNHA